MRRRIKRKLLLKELETKESYEIWNIKSRHFANYYDYFPEYKSRIEQALKIKRNHFIKTISKLSNHNLSTFNAIHVRRGEFQYKEQRELSNNIIIKTCLKHLDTNEDLVVLSDNSSTELLKGLKKHYRRVVCWAQDVKHQGKYDLIIDMLVGTVAKKFIGTKISTFSTGINTLRNQVHKNDPILTTIGEKVSCTSWNAIPGNKNCK